MRLSKPAAVSILFLTTVTFGCIVFWPFLLNELINPMARAAWVLLRLTVLSIDQIYYWGAAILVVIVFVIRLLPKDAPGIPAEELPGASEAVETIEYWRGIFTLIDINAHDKRLVKRELVRLVVALYASKQRTSPNFLFYNALQRGEISLPEPLHAFLFPEEPKEARSFREKLLKYAWEIPRKWRLRSKKQETAEYHEMIEEVLRFVEASLEMESADGRLSPNEY